MHSIGQSTKSSDRPCVCACVQRLRFHISVTVPDRRMVTMEYILVNRWWRIEWSLDWGCQ